jgi:hypothetical protein
MILLVGKVSSKLKILIWLGGKLISEKEIFVDFGRIPFLVNPLFPCSILSCMIYVWRRIVLFWMLLFLILKSLSEEPYEVIICCIGMLSKIA